MTGLKGNIQLLFNRNEASLNKKISLSTLVQTTIYKDHYYLGANNVETSFSGGHWIITDFINVNLGDVFEIKGYVSSYPVSILVAAYDTNSNYLPAYSLSGTDLGNGVKTITYPIYDSNVAKIKISADIDVKPISVLKLNNDSKRLTDAVIKVENMNVTDYISSNTDKDSANGSSIANAIRNGLKKLDLFTQDNQYIELPISLKKGIYLILPLQSLQTKHGIPQITYL